MSNAVRAVRHAVGKAHLAEGAILGVPFIDDHDEVLMSFYYNLYK